MTTEGAISPAVATWVLGLVPPMTIKDARENIMRGKFNVGVVERLRAMDPKKSREHVLCNMLDDICDTELQKKFPFAKLYRPRDCASGAFYEKLSPTLTLVPTHLYAASQDGTEIILSEHAYGRLPDGLPARMEAELWINMYLWGAEKGYYFFRNSLGTTTLYTRTWSPDTKKIVDDFLKRLREAFAFGVEDIAKIQKEHPEFLSYLRSQADKVGSSVCERCLRICLNDETMCGACESSPKNTTV
jgi:hypothetical protein